MASVQSQSTVFSTDNVLITTTAADGSAQTRSSQTVVQTVIPATTVYATTVVTSTESPTGIAGLQAQGLSGTDNGGGLSTGAKAGIGAGIGVLVIAAAIIGAVFAMRRRKRNRISEEDRYTQSSFGPSMIGAFKTNSRYSATEVQSQQMREANPLDRYATGVSSSQRASLPNQSRNGASDISSVSGVGSEQFRPGPGMPVVVEQPGRPYAAPMAGVRELDTSENHPAYQAHQAQYGYAATGAGNPFVNDDGHSMYSDDNDSDHQGPQRGPSNGTTSPAALELSGENTMNRQPSGGSGGGAGGQGYRGMDPEQPYHTRQLQKPVARQGPINPSQNF